MAKPIVVKIIGDADFGKATQELKGFGQRASGLATGIGAGIGLGLAGPVADAFGEALDFGAQKDVLAAQLGAFGDEAEELGALAGSLYSNAYGDSLEEVSSVVATLRNSVAEDIPTEALEDVAGQALSMQTAFGDAAGEYIALAGQLRDQGVFESVEEGLDFITTGFQQLPGEIRGDLTDAVEEYGSFLDSIGFSTEETFGLLTEAAKGGKFELDKTGDALKEFTIRATDMSTASTEAFGLIGKDAGEMGNAILAGGDDARGAFDEIVKGLLALEDPVEQANASIALFGTPLEDLGVDEIPAFLQSLDSMGAGFEDVSMAAEDLDANINDNLKTRLETFKRQGLQGLAKVLDAVVVPAIDAVIGVVDRLRPTVEIISAAMGTFIDTVVLGFRGATGSLDDFDLLIANLTEGGLAKFAVRVGQVVGEVVRLFGFLVEQVGALFGGGGGEGGGLLSTVQNAVNGIATALTPIVEGVLDFVRILRLGANGIEDETLPVVITLAEAVRGFAATLRDDVIPAVITVVDAVVDKWAELWPSIAPLLGQVVELFGTTFALVSELVRVAVEVITVLWDNLGDDLFSIIGIAFDLIVGVVSGALDIISGLFKVVTAILSGDWSLAWEGIKQIVSGALGIVGTLIETALRGILAAFRLVGSLIKATWDLLWSALKSFAIGGINSVVSFVSGGLGRLTGAFRRVKGAVSSAVRGLFDPIFDAFRGVIDKIRGLWSALDFSIPEVSIPGIGTVGGGTISGAIGKLPFFADGGVVNSPTLGVIGEAVDARFDPEIVSPESVMARTFARVLDDFAGMLGGPGIHVENLTPAPGRTIEDELDLLARSYLAR